MRAAALVAGVAVGAGFVAEPCAHAAEPWWNVGASEIVLAPDPAHYAVYGYLALTLPIDTTWHELYLIPGLALEVAPEVERGGLVVSITLERSLAGRVAGDAILSLAQDQPGLDVSATVFSLGIGVGLSLAFGDFSISPSFSIYRTQDGTAAWSLAPTLNLAHAL